MVDETDLMLCLPSKKEPIIPKQHITVFAGKIQNNHSHAGISHIP